MLSDRTRREMEKYKETNDIEIRDDFIIQYSSLIKIIAGKLSIYFANNIEYDDLVGYGIFGLVDAIDKYDYKKGIKFETYASLRIRGSIIDSVRKMDWIPRSLRQQIKKLELCISELESTLGRVPTEKELSIAMEVTIEEVKELYKKTAILSVVSLDDFLEQNHEIEFNSNINKLTPELVYEKEEVKAMLIKAIDKLSEKERMVVALYYFEDLTLKEISEIMRVSESRISQLHSKSILKLKDKLGNYKSILFSR